MRKCHLGPPQNNYLATYFLLSKLCHIALEKCLSDSAWSTSQSL